MTEIMKKRCKTIVPEVHNIIIIFKLNLKICEKTNKLDTNTYYVLHCVGTCNHLNRAIKIDGCFKTHLCIIPYWSYCKY